MEVSRAELAENYYPIPGAHERVPQTFFVLNDSEQRLYDSFRAKHENLRKFIEGLEDKGFGGNERKRGEDELEKMFMELVNPYLQRQGLEVLGCFTTYGDQARKTCLNMPIYRLFENNQPFNAFIELNYWFSTEDKNLSCESHLFYQSGNNDIYERYVLYDLLEKIIGGKEQDGITFPMIFRRGDFMYFASTEFSVPLIKNIRNILEKVGPEAMKELKILYKEYTNQRSRGEFSDTGLQQKVFREAYENKLEKALKIYELLNQPVRVSERIH